MRTSRTASRAAESRGVELGREAERAQLLALRAHLDPHFLFNTLNAIAEWCREDGEMAEGAVLRLSAMLRAGCWPGCARSSWPLADRAGAAAARCSISAATRCRKLYRLRSCTRARPAAGGEIPPLLLLPLAENAIKHGPAAGTPRAGSSLTVRATDEGRFCSTLDNPGRLAGTSSRAAKRHAHGEPGGWRWPT